MLANTAESGEGDRRRYYNIRKLAQPMQQISNLAGIYKNAYRDYPEYADTRDKDILSYLKSLWEESSPDVLVAEEKGNLLGFIVVDPCWSVRNGEPVGEVHEFVVDYRHQGRNIGATLLQAGIDYLENKGLSKIGLWVGNHNKPAQSLYKKYGFKKLYNDRTWTKMERQSRISTPEVNRKLMTKIIKHKSALKKQAAL